MTESMDAPIGQKVPEGIPTADNLFPFSAVADLPGGIGFAAPENPSGEVGISRIGRVLRGIMADNFIKIPSSWHGENNDERLIGTILPNVTQHPGARLVMDALSATYPELCWMRAGELTVVGGLAIPDGPVGLGAAGYLGDMRALGYALTEYMGGIRKHPVLEIIRFSEILRGAKDEVIRIGSEHRYDVNIDSRDSVRFPDWVRSNVKVYTLPRDQHGLAEARALLRTKAIPVTP